MFLSGELNKSIFKIIKSTDDLDEETSYWASKLPQERLAALEFLRHQYIHSQKLPTQLDKTFFGIRYGK